MNISPRGSVIPCRSRISATAVVLWLASPALVSCLLVWVYRSFK